MGRRQDDRHPEQFQYILRDESMHVNLVLMSSTKSTREPATVAIRHAGVGSRDDFEGTELEVAYARDTMPRGVSSKNANMMEEYLQFIANRRLAQIGLPSSSGNQEPFRDV